MILLFVSSVFLSYLVLAIVLNVLKHKNKSDSLKIAFFHPFCNDGGGGQKVLWCILDALLNQKTNKNAPQIAIYSLVQDKNEILQKVKNRFALDLTGFKDNIQIVYVPGKQLLVPQRKLTMVFHMILPIIYAVKCLFKYQPDVFYDTTGFASTLFLTKILLPNTKTTAYVHYPFISLDMIQKVKERRSDFNNDSSITNSPLKTKLKLLYYQTIFFLYKLNGHFVDFAQTNSSWTQNHMCQIWTGLNSKNKLIKLYPPCSVQDLVKFNKDPSSNKFLMMSLAQFRPEKNHKCQIKTVKRIIDELKKQKLNIEIKLYICGTTRGEDDERILNELVKLTGQLKLQKEIEFKVNKPFVEILKFFQEALIGIHTMEAQHFGISVVEMLAAGLIVVAHNSAGPKQDIVKEERFLATSEEDYYLKIMKVLKASAQERQSWINSNRIKAQGFGEKAFKENLGVCLEKQLGYKIKSN